LDRPGHGAGSGQSAFEIYQLRKDLEACGLTDPIRQTKIAGGSYSLNWNVIFDDILAYDDEIQRFQRGSSLTHALKAVQLYGGGYLSVSGYSWAAPRQAELELGFAELLEAVVDTYVRQQQYDIALDPMRKWAELNPLSARLHAKMISLLLLMNRQDDARSYHKLALELLDRAENITEIEFDRLAADPLRTFS
jgi:two-component SAPR family response regulator